MQQLARETIQDGATLRTACAVESLLDESIRQYDEVHELLLRLKKYLDVGAIDRVAGLLDEFNRMSAVARQQDSIIEEHLKVVQLTETLLEKLSQRQDLITVIVKLIEQTVSKAGTVKSCLASEFQSLKKGRAAIRGYRSGVSHHGRIVNRSS